MIEPGKTDSVDEVTPFKVCPFCSVIWASLEDLLSDSQVRLQGYQPDFDDLMHGIFLFNHLECNTTLSMRVERFQRIMEGPVYAELKVGSQECPEYCLKPDLLVACPSECACAFIRDLMQRINEWPNARAQAGDDV